MNSFLMQGTYSLNVTSVLRIFFSSFWKCRTDSYRKTRRVTISTAMTERQNAVGVLFKPITVIIIAMTAIATDSSEKRAA